MCCMGPPRGARAAKPTVSSHLTQYLPITLDTYMASTTSPVAAQLLSACSMHWVSDWMLALTLILTITLTCKGGASPWTRVPFFQVLCVRCRAGGRQLSLSQLLQSPLGLGCSPGTLTWPCWAFTTRAVTTGLRRAQKPNLLQCPYATAVYGTTCHY